ITGMVPMAIGLGEGGEQNAPLGRAVIGGLSLATVATLFFVPALFSLLHGRQSARRLKSDTGAVRIGTLAALLAIVAVLAVAWWGIASRAKAMVMLTRETNEMAVPTVAVVKPSRGAPTDEVVLPGSMQAFVDAPIYARTSG